MSPNKAYGRLHRPLFLLFPYMFLCALWSLFSSNAALTIPNAAAAPTAQLDLSLELFSEGLSLPTSIVNTGVPGDGRLFVTQQGGQIRILTANGDLLSTPFLNISSKVSLFGENGLLGLAFDPDYATNGYFYIYYTRLSDRNNVLARYQVSADANAADASSEQILLTAVQPKDGHNGGALAFGPDGYLYVAIGDGGLPDDGDPPPTTPQDRTSLLGKILRLDVAQSTAHAPDCGAALYTIPNDNPFRNGAGGDCDEIWALGLRNPWRFSFDRATGDLYIADVGENVQEEINFQPAGSSGGQNYGWPCYEGSALHHQPSCQAVTYTFPVFTYGHEGGHCSVTGGYVYRGQQYPAMTGHYLLADFCSGSVWNLHPQGSSWEVHEYADLTEFPTTFGEDINGELYVAELFGGTIYRVVENSVVAPTSLSISKVGPAHVQSGQPISYTLTVRNDGALPANNLTITDTLPTGTQMLSATHSGLEFQGVVTWNLLPLGPGDQVSVGLVVTPTAPIEATAVIRNEIYGVMADGGSQASGQPVVTIVNGSQIFVPVVLRP